MPRQVPLEVLVLGFCRTGTASMRSALSMLGYGNAHHIGRVMSNPHELDAWNAAIDAKFVEHKTLGRDEFDELLGEFRVVADVPGILFAQELVSAYPNALVILTTRDPDRWYTSLRATLIPMLSPSPFSIFTRLACVLDPRGLGRFIPFARRTLELVLGPEPLHALNKDKATATRRYTAYNDHIRRLVPTERLLEYEVGRDGWEPLCAFLGKDVPSGIEFPHRNDTQSIMEGSRKQIWEIYKHAAWRVVAPVLAAAVALSMVYMRRMS
ncbi:putative NAD dependent epimerase/dehydratase [Mycena amicta]|nr:putative NAD dependent epimerase/dehydratase [Mycena amicta]